MRTGELPIFRALTPTPDEQMIREFILQMKLGHVSKRYFLEKFGVDIHERFAAPLSELQNEGFLKLTEDGLRYTREGLLKVDWFLHRFFLPKHRAAGAKS